MSDTPSAHPEWDLIYRKGLTVRQIAELCGAVRGTVASHLRVVKGLDPEMYHDHVQNRPEEQPDTIWLQRFNDLKSFHELHREFPFKKSDDSEAARLARWPTDQRAKFKKGSLAQQKVDQLARHTWLGDCQRPRIDAERWERRLDDLRAYKAEHLRWPRHRNSKSEHERELGVWLHSPRQEASRGHLRDHHRASPDAAVPGWNTRKSKQSSSRAWAAAVV